MSDTILPLPVTTPSTAIATIAEQATAYAEAATADNTRRAYRAAWADFIGWCAERQLCPLPATEVTVGLYLADRAGALKRSTLGLRLAAISVAHKAKSYRLDTKAPQIANVLRGIGRIHGTAPAKKQAATLDVVRDAVRALGKDDSLKALRDRTIMLIGFAAALRRSEIAAIDIEHLRFAPEGLVLTLPRRKTDQEGQGTEIGIPFGQDAQYCPVRTAQALIERGGITNGPLFRSVTRGGAMKALRMTDRDIARAIQGAITAAGYDGANFGGHSLRSGFATTAGRAGVPERIIMLQTGHKSLPVLRGYIRRGSLFTENAAAMIGM
ncbi:MAG: site-specific integrase [Aestuariivirga sp.]|uniref:site-specific integrase n=1 Tax=Aestuariivirga sp. TaxID=2650926 RepID=UPI003019BDBE